MVKSKYTETLEKQFILFSIFDWICLFLPTIIYVFIAWFDSGITVPGKVAVAGTVLIALILTVFNIIAKKNLTCVIWIVLIGLFVAFDQFLIPLIFIMAITSAIHDFLLGPLVETYKMKVVASKTEDERKAFESVN